MRQSSPLVSVVIPSYNQARFIRKTIDSVINQTYANIEILVIDGGSNDGTIEILQQYNDRIFWLSEKDRGQTHAINKGFKLAKGEYVTWLCSDDFYVPFAIEKMMSPFISMGEVGLTYGDSYYIADTEENIILAIKAPGELTLDKLLKKGESLAQPSSLIRKTVLDQLGYLDESLKYAMDYDLWIRLIKVANAVYIAEPLSYYRLHSSSKTVHGADDSSKEVLAIMRKNGVSIFSKHSLKRYKSISISFLKKVLGIRNKPIKEWKMWSNGIKKIS